MTGSVNMDQMVVDGSWKNVDDKMRMEKWGWQNDGETGMENCEWQYMQMINPYEVEGKLT